MTFDQALTFVLSWEGGYSNHPDDPGGETNMGITKRSAEAHGYRGDIKSIHMSLVRRIYRAYWDKCRCDDLPNHPLRLVVFDAGFNSGPGQSVKWLQTELNVKADGLIGPKTLAALAAVRDLDDLALDLIQRRLNFLRSLKTWRTFGKGWSARIAALREVVTG